MSDDTVVVRRAETGDADGIARVYNYAVLHLAATAQETAQAAGERALWIADHDAHGLPVFVAVMGDKVVGWSSLSAFHARSGYRYTAENSVYVDAGQWGQGLGKLLLAPLLTEAQRLGFHAIVAWVDGDNAASMRLHAGFGFREAGRFREVIRKFDRWLDVVVMELLLPGPAPPAPSA